MTSNVDTDDFPHPYVAVDVVLLAVVDGAVRVLLVERSTDGVTGWGLPGAYLQLAEDIAGTRARVLREKCGVTGVADAGYRPLPPRDAVERDPRRRTVSLVAWAPVSPAAVAALAPGAALGEIRLRRGRPVVRVEGRQERLAVDHGPMVADAALALAGEVDHLAPAERAVPELLPDRFTAREVEDVLTVVGALVGREAPDTNALRRRLQGVTEGTGDREELAPGQRHRPAELRRWLG